jgi:hypothetical protein
VDDRDKVVLVDRLEADGTYRNEQVSEGIVTSVAIPDFWIEAGWLWSDPLPNPRRCLESILAGPPGGG